MSTNYHSSRYVLIIPIPREIEIRLEDRFLNLSGTTKPGMGYHITLLGSFLLPESLDPLALPAINHVCAATEPFEVEIAGVGGFEAPDSHVVYVDVSDTTAIKALHQNLLAALEQTIRFVDERARIWNTTSSYHPHVTLGLNLSDAQYRSFLRTGADVDCRATFAVTEIALVAQAANGPWRRLATYPLGAAASQHKPSIAYGYQ